ncbi:cellulase family glycosylhydrolase [Solimonas marina]|uniref:Glycoside hydrolase family 5 protein n=1 Tax=Solimonas marina TaxID=2714601 RepID=A0A969W561_9GAMM|nr:cellulase family glycosylhydrolase [Solimonas marina]NKF20777.1 glycoside hydrolase family 5 protein [Solimonas marina]
MQHRFSISGTATIVLLLASAGLLAACGGGNRDNGDATAQAAMSLRFLHVEAAADASSLAQIVDPYGRTVLLRGINVSGIRDDYVDNDTPLVPQYPIDPAAYTDGKCPQPGAGYTQLAVCEADAQQLRSYGYDVVRLPVSWSLLEPQPGEIDTQYIDRIAQVVGWFKQAGIYTVIDLHQDAWSKYVYTAADASCPPLTDPVTGAHEADGAPEWASQYLTPACMMAGTRELDLAVEEDFTRFWLNQPAADGVGLQDHFAAVVLALAQRFHDEPAVAGYELFNEPLPGLEVVPELVDLTSTFPFYAKVVKTVTGALPDFQQLFFIEPDALRNVTDQRSEFTPWSLYSSYPNVVYAPHIYTDVFTLNAIIGSIVPGLGQVLDPLFPMSASYANAAGDARILGLPLWVGEFGNGTPNDDTQLREHYEYNDQYRIGSALWTWKQLQALDSASCYCDLHGPAPDQVAEIPSRRKFSARAYPLYTAGTLESLQYDPDDSGFDLQATAADAVAVGDTQHATVLYVPATVSGEISVEGAELQTVKRDDGSRELYVYPTGGAYRVHS